MTTGSSVWRSHWRGYGLAGGIVTAIAWGLWHYGERIGLDSTGMKLLGFAGAISFLLLLRYGNSIELVVQQRWHRTQAKRKAELPTDESRLAQTPPHNVTVANIRHAMRTLYGRHWSRKVRILLVTGSVSDVEQLTPGLTAQYWQEDRGTLLLWGGDLASPVEHQWLTALRKLRQRPADGMVWVTSAFDRLSALGLPPPPPRPADSMMDTFFHAIRARNDVLGWRLPLYVWSLHPRAGQSEGGRTQAAGCLLPAACTADLLRDQLQALVPELIAQGIQQICRSSSQHFLLNLADQLIREPDSITVPLFVMLNPYRALPLAGMVFSPVSVGAACSVQHCWAKDKRWEVIPDSIREHPASLRPRQPGFCWQRVMGPTAALLMVLWTVWMGVSFISNRDLILHAREQVIQASAQQSLLTDRLLSLLAMQKTLSRLQSHTVQGAPWAFRAGLGRSDELLTALWPGYQARALPLLRDASADYLQQQLNAFISLSPESPRRETMARGSYDSLKLYLMLAHPAQMNAAEFSAALLQHWPQREGIEDRHWQGIAPALLTFYAENLATHPHWRLAADTRLVSQARALLIRQMGVRNSESSQYQTLLAQVVHQYADMRLEDMVGDTDASRLFTTQEVVPGVFTRQAWEQAVQPAIARVVNARRDALDWVLTDTQPQPQQSDSAGQLQQRLTERYFADFSGAWLMFLNSLRLQRVTTLSDAIDQLTLLADVRQSPLIALMNTLNIQGRTGQNGVALADTLVQLAKNLPGRDNQEAIDQSADTSPLETTFGPVLVLTDKHRSGGQTQSLQRYLTRVTEVRLRLQQITQAADPQAMAQVLAQTVFQGKSVDLDDGSLIAAELGQAWRGFGRTVFVQPMAQAWQQLLTPAADSLNRQWQQTVINDWNRAFGGRYPFSDASSEVSLPLLAKYLNTDSGRIAQFLESHLQGVLHREGSRWVPDSINARGLHVNLTFLKAINTLSQLSDVAFTQNPAGIYFELRPGTAREVMQTRLILDSQQLIYVNQMPTWKRFSWPADTEAPGASLSWMSSQSGTRQYADMPGSWGWIRLLEKAVIKAYPGQGSSYSLSWIAQDGRPLNYTLRTEVGEGPLALLKLRHFRLPATIFTVDPARVQASLSGIDAEEIY